MKTRRLYSNSNLAIRAAFMAKAEFRATRKWFSPIHGGMVCLDFAPWQ
jgi:hypothetical protein